MIHEVNARISLGLDRLDMRGRRHLARGARIEAMANAASLALITFPLVPAAALLGGLVIPFDPFAVTAATVAVPTLAFAILWWHGIHRATPIGRRVALATIDRDLALKDRLSATHQFLGEPDSGGFRRAAIAEAEPWIERAQAMALTSRRAALAPVLRRRWPYPAAALVLLVLAVLISHTVPPRSMTGTDSRSAQAAAGAGVPGADATRSPRGSSSADAARTADQGATVTVPAAGSAGGLLAAVRAQAGAAMAAASEAMASLTGGPPSRETAASGSGSRSASAGEGAGAGTSGGKRSGTAADAADARTSPRDGKPDASSERRADDDDDDAAVVASSTQAAQSAGASPSAPSQRNGPPRDAPTPGRPQPSQSSENQNSGNQASSSPSPAPGSNRSGQQPGDEGAKKGRGFAGMLLATPMRDRVTGLKSRGAVTVVTAPAPPQTLPSGQVVAGDRGVNAGDAGQQPHRAAAAYENGLVRGYFDAARPRGGDR